MTRITQDLRDEITSAMMGVLDRYDDIEPVDMPPLARALSEECCRIVEALDRGRAVIPVQIEPIWETTSQAITILSRDDPEHWDNVHRPALAEGALL